MQLLTPEFECFTNSQLWKFSNSEYSRKNWHKIQSSVEHAE